MLQKCEILDHYLKTILVFQIDHFLKSLLRCYSKSPIRKPERREEEENKNFNYKKFCYHIPEIISSMRPGLALDGDIEVLSVGKIFNP